jgi:hypothetical protein
MLKSTEVASFIRQDLGDDLLIAIAAKTADSVRIFGSVEIALAQVERYFVPLSADERATVLSLIA